MPSQLISGYLSFSFCSGDLICCLHIVWWRGFVPLHSGSIWLQLPPAATGWGSRAVYSEPAATLACSLTATAFLSYRQALWPTSWAGVQGGGRSTFFCLCNPGGVLLCPHYLLFWVAGMMKTPSNSLASSVWGFPSACERTWRAKVFPQRAPRPPLSELCLVPCLGLLPLGEGEEIPLPPSTSFGESSTSTSRRMSAWVSQTPFVLCECPLLVYECPFPCILVGESKVGADSAMILTSNHAFILTAT